jgi:beta-alanine degradation protein BauB
MTNSAKSTVFIDNDRVRVTEWRLPSGTSTGWHRHAYDYVVVPINDGLLRLLEPGGISREVQLRQGVPYFRNAGVEHDVVNANADEYAFIEIEIK